MMPPSGIIPSRPLPKGSVSSHIDAGSSYQRVCSVSMLCEVVPEHEQASSIAEASVFNAFFMVVWCMIAQMYEKFLTLLFINFS
jgi:hypothetical protein